MPEIKDINYVLLLCGRSGEENQKRIFVFEVPYYKGQDIDRFIKNDLGFQSIEQFKKQEGVYEFLNNGERSYQHMISRLKEARKMLKNLYTIRKNRFEIEIQNTILIGVW